MYRKICLLTAMVVPLSYFDNMTCLASAEDAPSQHSATTPPATHQKWIDLLSGSIENLTANQCRESALGMLHDKGTDVISAEPTRLSLAAKAFARYFELIPFQDGQTTCSKEDHSFNDDAVITFFFLSTPEKRRLAPHFTGVLRWTGVRAEEQSPQTLLMAMDCLALLGHEEDAHKASYRFAAHSEALQGSLNYPLLAGAAYLLLEKNDVAATLYEMALLKTPQDFSIPSLKNASYAFDKERRLDLSIKITKMLLDPEAYGLMHKKADLIPSDYLDAAGCYMAAQNFDGAFELLQYYFANETGEITPDAYRLMAHCYTHLDDYLAACEHWQIILNKKQLKHASDYINAATAFSQIGAYERASQLLRRALEIAPELGGYHVCVQACEILTMAKDYESALTTVHQYMRARASVPPQERTKTDLVNAALIYRQNHLYEESGKIWDILSLDKHQNHQQMCLSAINDHLQTGNFRKASDAFLRLTHAEMNDAVKKDPALLTTAIVCHQSADRQRDVEELITRHRDKLTIIPLTSKSDTTRAPSPSARKGKKTSTLNKSPSSRPELVKDLRASYAATLLAKMNDTFRKVGKHNHEALDALYQEMQHLNDRASHLLSVIQGRTAPSSETPSVSSSSSSSSSASSSSSSSSTHVTPAVEVSPSEDPLTTLQRLSTRMAELKSSYGRAKDKLDQQTAKEVKKAWLQKSLTENAFVWNPAAYQSSDKRAKVKKGRAKPAKPRSVSPAQHSSSSSSISSSSSHASTPSMTRVEWRITPTAQKHMASLRSVRGFQDKFDEFRHEIEMEPWGRRGHTDIHASGRAKHLKGHDNVFSRRFAKGERFFYRVELAQDGRVIVTILGLMKHDL